VNFTLCPVDTKKNEFEQEAEEFLEKHEGYYDFKEKLGAVVSALNNDSGFMINRQELLKGYPCLRKYRYKLPGHLDKISNTKFKMKYKVKCIFLETWGLLCESPDKAEMAVMIRRVLDADGSTMDQTPM
jgi:hypothetical protein